MRALKLLGAPLLVAGGAERPLAAERRHQLLAYLAWRARWVPRLEVAELFWEEHESEAARRNLRRLLFDVRALPWIGTLEAQGDSLRWDVATDVAAFDAAFAARDWAAAVEQGAGTLLEGMERGATEAFHDWLLHAREKHRRRWAEAVARRRAQLGPGDERIDLALAALDHDPYDHASGADLARLRAA
jgi:DNA-binding SARP family transcriptional activator